MREIPSELSDSRKETPAEMRAPSAINVSRAERTIAVVWSDTHTSLYGLDDLRSMCDCASCRSDREKAEQKRVESPRTLPVLGAAVRADITSISHVGLYAIGVGWKDGHQSIFTYEYLLGSCLCKGCAQVNGTDPGART